MLFLAIGLQQRHDLSHFHLFLNLIPQLWMWELIGSMFITLKSQIHYYFVLALSQKIRKTRNFRIFRGESKRPFTIITEWQAFLDNLVQINHSFLSNDNKDGNILDVGDLAATPPIQHHHVSEASSLNNILVTSLQYVQPLNRQELLSEASVQLLIHPQSIWH